MSQSKSSTELTIHGKARAAVSRREAMQWVLAAMAASALPNGPGARAAEPSAAAPAAAQGYGRDLVMTKTYAPGDLWPLVLTDAQRATAVALADVILPADQYGPAASELDVAAMVDEWVSSPYEAQKGDRQHIPVGLDWLETESQTRFAKAFGKLSIDQQRAICDDICFEETAKPQFKQAAIFFSRFRSIAAAAYFSTPPGWKAIGYVGNVALEKFDGPPQEVLDKLGVTQTVI